MDAEKLIHQLMTLLAALQKSQPFPASQPNAVTVPPHGVYVFYENEVPMYVGRTSGESKYTLAARVRSHFSGPPSNANFAFKMALDEWKSPEGHGGSPRKELLKDEAFQSVFKAQKARVKCMTVQAVQVDLDSVQDVFEKFASVVLEPRYYSGRVF